jgi:hypothetical protein
MESAYKKYEQFHGRRSRKTASRPFHVPSSLVYLGEAVAVEYLSDKLNGGGDGAKAIYRHKFSPGAVLCMDEKARGQLYILGSKIYVNDRGIVK